MGQLGSGGTQAERRGNTIPPLGVISTGKPRFRTHEWCAKKAIKKFKKRFEEEWSVILGMIFAGTLVIHYCIDHAKDGVPSDCRLFNLSMAAPRMLSMCTRKCQCRL